MLSGHARHPPSRCDAPYETDASGARVDRESWPGRTDAFAGKQRSVLRENVLDAHPRRQAKAAWTI